MRLLIAEDDPRLLRSLMHIVTAERYAADGVTNGNDALDYARSGEYDGLILDIMMPGLDGLQVLTTLRREGITTPALFLSARTEVEQRVEGLDAGADDYLPKPFSVQELLARVRAMLRRRDRFSPETVSLGGTTLDRSACEISCGGSVRELCGKELQILVMLTEHPGAAVSTEQIITHVWGWNTDVDPSVVWVHISNLRKKLEAIGSSWRIRFIRGAGYVLEGET